MLLNCPESRLPPNALQIYKSGAFLQGETLDPSDQSFYTQVIWQKLILQQGWEISSYLGPHQTNNYITKGSGNFRFYRNTDLETKITHLKTTPSFIIHVKPSLKSKEKVEDVSQRCSTVSASSDSPVLIPRASR